MRDLLLSGRLRRTEHVEGEASNLCFIISAEQVKRHHSDPETVVREAVMKNRRAAYTLEHAQPNPSG